MRKKDYLIEHIILNKKIKDGYSMKLERLKDRLEGLSRAIPDKWISPNEVNALLENFIFSARDLMQHLIKQNVKLDDDLYKPVFTCGVLKKCADMSTCLLFEVSHYILNMDLRKNVGQTEDFLKLLWLCKSFREDLWKLECRIRKELLGSYKLLDFKGIQHDSLQQEDWIIASSIKDVNFESSGRNCYKPCFYYEPGAPRLIHASLLNLNDSCWYDSDHRHILFVFDNLTEQDIIGMVAGDGVSCEACPFIDIDDGVLNCTDAAEYLLIDDGMDELHLESCAFNRLAPVYDFNKMRAAHDAYKLSRDAALACNEILIRPNVMPTEVIVTSLGISNSVWRRLSAFCYYYGIPVFALVDTGSRKELHRVDDILDIKNVSTMWNS